MIILFCVVIPCACGALAALAVFRLLSLLERRRFLKWSAARARLHVDWSRALLPLRCAEAGEALEAGDPVVVREDGKVYRANLEPGEELHGEED